MLAPDGVEGKTRAKRAFCLDQELSQVPKTLEAHRNFLRKCNFPMRFFAFSRFFFFRRVFQIQSFGIIFSAKSCSGHSAGAFSTVSIFGFARALFAPNAICKGSPRRLLASNSCSLHSGGAFFAVSIFCVGRPLVGFHGRGFVLSYF